MKCSLILPALLAVLVVTTTVVPASAIAPTTASSTFNLNGVTGWIRFYEMENVTSILVNLVGFNGQTAGWSIRPLPVDNTLWPLDRCSEDYLGGIYNATTVQGVAVGDLTARYGNKHILCMHMCMTLIVASYINE